MYAPEKYKRRFLEQGYDKSTAARYGMIENVDDNFGTLMASLKKWQALDNTLIIFMTDNGMSMAPIKHNGKKSYPYNAGMKGRKNTPWEGGTHVPSFWYWQGVLQENVNIDALTAHIDLYQTFSDLAGAKIPESKLPPTGRSLVPLLDNEKAPWADRQLFVHQGRWDDNRKNKKTRSENKYNNGAVRTEQWRLVYTLAKGNVRYFLSDINKDPGETTNLAGKFPEVVKTLTASYNKWWDSTEKYLVNEKLPEINAEQQPLTIKYNQQLKTKGIPHWAPKQNNSASLK